MTTPRWIRDLASCGINDVPLVGGKLESLIEGLLKLFLSAEGTVGQTWLAGER